MMEFRRPLAVLEGQVKGLYSSHSVKVTQEILLKNDTSREVILIFKITTVLVDLVSG